MGTSTTPAPPATARRTKPAATPTTSSTARCFNSPDASGGGGDDVGGHHDGQVPLTAKAAGDRAEDARCAQRPGEREGDLAGGDGPEPLGGVEAIGLDVDGVVQVVRAGRRQAEASEHAERVVRRGGFEVVDDAGCAEHREQQQVLHPLLGTGLDQQGPDRASRVVEELPKSASVGTGFLGIPARLSTGVPPVGLKEVLDVGATGATSGVEDVLASAS
nr:hypothetical protein [Aquihabitans sp. G128]